MLKLTHKGIDATIKIKVEGGLDTDTAVATLVRLLRAAGYSEGDICESLAECEEVSDYHNRYGIKLLTRGDLAEMMSDADLTPAVQSAVFAAIFGKEGE
jgi:hypothetical protein